jgi:hypothetical protein
MVINALSSVSIRKEVAVPPKCVAKPRYEVKPLHRLPLQVAHLLFVVPFFYLLLYIYACLCCLCKKVK